MKLIKRYSKEEVEVTRKGEKVKKHLPYYVLQAEVVTSANATPKKVSVIIKPSFNNNIDYANLDLLAEKE